MGIGGERMFQNGAKQMKQGSIRCPGLDRKFGPVPIKSEEGVILHVVCEWAGFDKIQEGCGVAECTI